MRPGAVVAGVYRLERVLGRGGMGVVHLATHLPTGAPVALKSLPATSDPELTLRFQREGEALARVDRHPHVVRVHAAGVEAGRSWLALDLVPGGDLTARLAGGPLPVDEVVALGRALAAGLAHVHAHGVLHRDLKPANVLFDAEGAPRLADFGLAKLVDERSLTQTGQLLGTPAYMAPEQARGDRAAQDARTDVYGLGAVLFHALTGAPPFEGRSPVAVLEAVARGARPRVRAARPDCPRWLAAVVERALARAPDARFASAADLGAALAAGAAGAAGPARRRLVLAGAAALAAALAGGVAALGRLGPAAPRPASPEVDLAAPGSASGVVEGGEVGGATGDAQPDDRAPVGPSTAPSGPLVGAAPASAPTAGPRRVEDVGPPPDRPPADWPLEAEERDVLARAWSPALAGDVEAAAAVSFRANRVLSRRPDDPVCLALARRFAEVFEDRLDAAGAPDAKARELSARGWAHLADGLHPDSRPDERDLAIALLERALRQRPTLGSARWRLLRLLGERPAGARDLERAVELALDMVDDRDHLASASRLLGRAAWQACEAPEVDHARLQAAAPRLEAAAARLEARGEHAPAAGAWLALGAIERRLGRREVAAGCLERAALHHPDSTWRRVARVELEPLRSTDGASAGDGAPDVARAQEDPWAALRVLDRWGARQDFPWRQAAALEARHATASVGRLGADVQAAGLALTARAVEVGLPPPRAPAEAQVALAALAPEEFPAVVAWRLALEVGPGPRALPPAVRELLATRPQVRDAPPPWLAEDLAAIWRGWRADGASAEALVDLARGLYDASRARGPGAAVARTEALRWGVRALAWLPPGVARGQAWALLARAFGEGQGVVRSLEAEAACLGRAADCGEPGAGLAVAQAHLAGLVDGAVHHDVAVGLAAVARSNARFAPDPLGLAAEALLIRVRVARADPAFAAPAPLAYARELARELQAALAAQAPGAARDARARGLVALALAWLHELAEPSARPDGPDGPEGARAAAAEAATLLEHDPGLEAEALATCAALAARAGRDPAGPLGRLRALAARDEGPGDHAAPGAALLALARLELAGADAPRDAARTAALLEAACERAAAAADAAFARERVERLWAAAAVRREACLALGALVADGAAEGALARRRPRALELLRREVELGCARAPALVARLARP